MAVRPINAINLKKYIKGLDVTLPYDEQDKDDVIRQVCCIIGNWPTLTPPNEPEYREYACPYCSHTWLEDREGRCVVLPCKIFDKVWDVIAH